MTQLSDLERSALKSMIAEQGFLWNGLQKYFVERQEYFERQCAAEMRMVPRNHELASDYAAKAEVFQYLPAQLESFARDL